MILNMFGHSEMLDTHRDFRNTDACTRPYSARVYKYCFLVLDGISKTTCMSQKRQTNILTTSHMFRASSNGRCPEYSDPGPCPGDGASEWGVRSALSVPGCGQRGNGSFSR